MIINHVIIPLMGCFAIIGLAVTARDFYRAFKDDIRGLENAITEGEEEHRYQHQRVEEYWSPTETSHRN